MAGRFQQPGNGISQNCLAPMTYGERTGGIGTDKLNQHLFILPHFRISVGVGLVADRFNYRLPNLVPNK